VTAVQRLAVVPPLWWHAFATFVCLPYMRLAMVLPDLCCCSAGDGESAGQSGRDTLHHMQLKQLEDNNAGWPPCGNGVLAQCCWLGLQPTEPMCCSTLFVCTWWPFSVAPGVL
jgi:hypothetical protein